MDALGNRGFGMGNLVSPQEVRSQQWNQKCGHHSSPARGSRAAPWELFQACDQIVLFPSENNALKTHVMSLLRVTNAVDDSNVTMGLTMQNLQIASQKISWRSSPEDAHV